MFGVGVIAVLLIKLVVAGGTTAGLAKGSHWFNKKTFNSKKVGAALEGEHETEKRHH